MDKDYVWKPKTAGIFKESEVHPHIPEERAELFDVADGGSTEYEVLNWLHASIRLLKPQLILETGGWEGMGTVALAHACKLNGFGKVHTIELKQEQCVLMHQILEAERLLPWVEIHAFDSLEFLKQTKLKFDIAFFDSLTEIRPDECEILLNNKALSKLGVFHDTSPLRSISAPYFTLPEVQDNYRKKIMDLTKHSDCTGFYESKLSRGFMALFFNG